MVASNTVENRVVEEKIEEAQNEYAVSIVVPTRNEAGNVKPLLTSIRNALYGRSIEVIFVDDSTDETPQMVEASAGLFPFQHVRLIHRLPEQRAGGLGSAVVMGLRAAQAEYVCVMDGDLQHPPEVIPQLLKAAVEKQADLVVATRRSEKSQVTGLSVARNMISKGLDLVARVFFPRQLRGVSDPLTGFFLVRPKALDLDSLHPNGFKILLEILVRNPKLNKAEVPFHFGERLSGESKASTAEAWKYFNLLWTMRFGSSAFIRFFVFAMVGFSGIFVNSLAVYLVTDKLHVYYLYSAAIATVASTTWNFALTEALVYRKQKRAKGMAGRFGLFFIMNSIALALRTPMIYAMTTWLGVYYVASNLISLVVLTVLRFLLADNLIWGKKPANTSANDLNQSRRKTMGKLYSYSIHGIVSVTSQTVLPELEPFRVNESIANPTIQVRSGMPRKAQPGEENGKYMRYQEVLGPIGFEVGIEMGEAVDVVYTPILGLSPHVLYTNVVEPILRWTFVRKGYALVHGATIAFGDSAYMITARTDTGKTTTLLKILAYQRRERDKAAFLSDDMTIVSPDGTALTYPKPLTISAHTLRAVNADTLNFKERIGLPFQSRIHSRSGRKFAQLIGKTHMPAATINMFTQMVVPPPKYFVSKLVPNVKLTEKAHLTGMFIIERGDEEAIQPIANAEAMKVLLQNCEDAYGFPPYESIKEFLYCVAGYDLHEKEEEIIREALGTLPATNIRSNHLNWWSQIPAYVNNEQVSVDISRAVEVETYTRARLTKQPEHINAQ